MYKCFTEIPRIKMHPYTLTQLDRWNPFSAPFTSMHQNEQPIQSTAEETHPKQKPPSVHDTCFPGGECGEFVHWLEDMQWLELEEKEEETVLNGGKASCHTCILPRAMVANGNGMQNGFGQQKSAMKDTTPNGVHNPKDIKHCTMLWAKIAGLLFFSVLTSCLFYVFQTDEIVTPLLPLDEEKTLRIEEEFEDTVMLTSEWIFIIVAETVVEFISLTKLLFSFFIGWP